jgi:transcriptional regulator with XRE-family HTH domain
MAADVSPLAARRRVRQALREAREAKGLTQGQIAEAMEWSLSKVMRIEGGEVTIAPNDLRPLLAYLDLTDQSRVEALLEDSRLSRRRRPTWWEEPSIRDHLTPAMRKLIGFEADAAAVRYYYGMIIPGRLQTRAYAQAILDYYRTELNDEGVRLRVDARMRRREELLAQDPRPDILLLLDESVLYRQLGDDSLVAEQLLDLLGLIEMNRVVVRVVPFNVKAPPPLFGSFEILDLGGGDAVMYRESSVSDEIVEDSAKIRSHRKVFEQLWNAAYSEAESARLLQERVVSGGSAG